MPRKLSHDKTTDLQGAIGLNQSSRKICKRFSVGKSTVNRYANKLNPDRQRAKGGRPSIDLGRTGRYLSRDIVSGLYKTAKEAHVHLCDLGFRMSYQSCINQLKRLGFHAAIKKKKPLLSARHRQRRLAWAKSHENWTTDDWRRVIFSDETKINIWGSDGCKYYWVRPGDRMMDHHLDLTVKHGGGSLMMWGCITSQGPGYACQIYDGTMKAVDYQGILGTALKDTMEYYGLDWDRCYFQHDGDPKHRARSTTEYMEKNGITVLEDWPAQSPDLNPIEHIWHHLKLKLSTYEKKAKGVHELWERVEKEWETFDENTCRRYIDSMPARIKAVIDAKGGHTSF